MQLEWSVDLLDDNTLSVHCTVHNWTFSFRIRCVCGSNSNRNFWEFFTGFFFFKLTKLIFDIFFFGLKMIFHNMWQVLQTLNQLKLNHLHFDTVFHFNFQINRCDKKVFYKFHFFKCTNMEIIIRFLETSRRNLILNDGITKIYLVESTKWTIPYLSLHRYVTTCKSKSRFLLTFCFTNYWWWITFFSLFHFTKMCTNKNIRLRRVSKRSHQLWWLSWESVQMYAVAFKPKFWTFYYQPFLRLGSHNTRRTQTNLLFKIYRANAAHEILFFFTYSFISQMIHHI